MPKTLEEIRVLPVDDLTDNDKKLLKDSWSDLTAEEQDAFGDAVNGGGDEHDEDQHKHEEHKEEEKLPFKTQAELDAYINAKLKEATKPPEDDKDDENKIEIPDIFDKGYKPADWNEAFRAFIEKGGKYITGMTEAQLQKKQSELRIQVDKINKQIDSEIDALTKDGKDIPKLGTEERTKLNADLGKIATDYHMDNAPAAKVYEIYEMTKGGGEDKRKSLARKIFGGGGGGVNNKTAIPHADIHKKSMDQLIEEHSE